VLNCGEEILCGDRPLGVGPTGGHCTDVAIARDGRTVVGHNEDWIEDDIENMVVLDVTVPDGTRFLSLTGAAYLPNCGLNSHGMALYGNTLYSADERAGVPNSFKLRWMLEARDRGEADARACMAGRARGSNHVLGQAGGHLWDIETSATRETTIEADEWLAHANHFVAESMRDVERSDSAGSRHRLERACELVRDGLARGDDPVALASAVLRDHANAPWSICSHPLPDDAGHGPTTGSVVVEVEERRLHVCAGAPCENEYLLVTMK
jgi:isopenicillin-N N-acyltransferase-like protein